MTSSGLKLKQLDDVLQPLAVRSLPERPRGGWLEAVRTALGLTTRQLAARIGISQPTLVAAERREAAETISLGQLRRMADALNCDLRYVLVPRIPLAEQVDAQAERKARERVASVAHSMALEAQRAGGEFERQQIAAVKDELLRGRRSRLWD
jgi:predicted DNA-binding mobile mystery protein A